MNEKFKKVREAILLMYLPLIGIPLISFTIGFLYRNLYLENYRNIEGYSFQFNPEGLMLIYFIMMLFLIATIIFYVLKRGGNVNETTKNIHDSF